jgi:hypothetical protein
VRGSSRQHPWCSSRVHLRVLDRTSGTSGTRLLRSIAVCPTYAGKIRLPLSLFNSLTFLAPWAGDYSLRSGVDYSLRPGVVRTPRAYLFSPLKISPEAGGLRLVLPVETKCGHRKCHKRHCQQVCGASGRLSLWSGSHVFKVDSGLVGKLVTWDLLSP